MLCKYFYKYKRYDNYLLSISNNTILNFLIYFIAANKNINKLLILKILCRSPYSGTFPYTLDIYCRQRRNLP